MNDSATPSPISRRPLAIILILAIVLLALGSLYAAIQDDPPQWRGLAYPLMMGLFGLFYWQFPETSHLSPTWTRRAVIFLFGMCALMLISYFV